MVGPGKLVGHRPSRPGSGYATVNKMQKLFKENKPYSEGKYTIVLKPNEQFNKSKNDSLDFTCSKIQTLYIISK